ncbi:MAG: hypothetical protein K6E20_07340 [Acholeplasmatales bacterium]|nr:hypothetical protein [Acholeplasmatales bacterium]
MNNKIYLENLISNETLDSLKKYNLYDSSFEIINNDFMINIDACDFKTVVNNRLIVAYIDQEVVNTKEVNVHLVKKIEEGSDYLGFIVVRGNHSTSIKICDEIIENVKKALNTDISFIFSFDVDYKGQGIKITSIITKR